MDVLKKVSSSSVGFIRAISLFGCKFSLFCEVWNRLDSVSSISVLTGMEWKPLSVNQYCVEEEPRPSSPRQTSLITSMASVQIAEPANPLTSTLFDWGGDKEPVDIDRNMADVTLVEVSWK
jgi:hypothetical protein